LSHAPTLKPRLPFARIGYRSGMSRLVLAVLGSIVGVGVLAVACGGSSGSSAPTTDSTSAPGCTGACSCSGSTCTCMSGGTCTFGAGSDPDAGVDDGGDAGDAGDAAAPPSNVTFDCNSNNTCNVTCGTGCTTSCDGKSTCNGRCGSNCT